MGRQDDVSLKGSVQNKSEQKRKAFSTTTGGRDQFPVMNVSRLSCQLLNRLQTSTLHWITNTILPEIRQ